MSDEILGIAARIRELRYPGSEVIFVAGSLMRGEGTATSDIDLVVVYEQVPNAYRESYWVEGYPVEAFINDPETLNYFFHHVDLETGIPILPSMVHEGIVIPGASDISRRIKALANSVMESGPHRLTPADERHRRYTISNLLDDLEAPRTQDELRATGTLLYQELADYHLRRAGKWSARGKAIPRELNRLDGELGRNYVMAFANLFEHNDPFDVLTLGKALLEEAGGTLFDGYRRDAPAAWRRPLD